VHHKFVLVFLSSYETLWVHVFILGRVMVMVFNTTFNNLSDISWWSVLLVEETGEPRENHPPVGGHWQTFIANIYSIEYTSPWVGMELTTLVVMCTDCICICKSNLQYHHDHDGPCIYKWFCNNINDKGRPKMCHVLCVIGG
jgi:hypothetical protein